ncbi:hypothetical protein LWI30_04060 [Staphylococcus epidermidis]|uniref:hypothetical protein n=1 Tax=Staphylococcus epidermidis TaxID=1282 RepID=UPI001E653BC9|nr:hypothetical protein [Staphylococcus epidermidis]MCG3213558.1 hypothetical protein [Staphylococcus epidermidis]
MQKSKLDLKTILTIILVIILAIISFVLIVGYIISSVDPKHSIEGYAISINFVGIFATFGGASLGAYLSGIFALKTTEKTQKIKLENDLKKLQACIRINISEIDTILDKISDYTELKKDKLLDYLKKNSELTEKNLENKEKIIHCWQRSINPELLKEKYPLIRFEMDTISKIEQTINFLDKISSNFYLLNIQSRGNDHISILYNYKKYLIELKRLINDEGTGGKLRIRELSEEASFKLPLIYYYHNLIYKKII